MEMMLEQAIGRKRSKSDSRKVAGLGLAAPLQEMKALYLNPTGFVMANLDKFAVWLAFASIQYSKSSTAVMRHHWNSHMPTMCHPVGDRAIKVMPTPVECHIDVTFP